MQYKSCVVMRSDVCWRKLARLAPDRTGIDFGITGGFVEDWRKSEQVMRVECR